MNEKIKRKDLLGFEQILKLFKENSLKIILWGLFGAMIAFVVSFFFITPKYESTIDLLVSQKTPNEQVEYNVQQADLQAINTYKDVLKKPIILEPVLKQIKRQDNYQGNIGDLENSISIKNETNSQVISVAVNDSNAYIAADIANTIGKTFNKNIKKIMKINNVSIVSSANISKKPISPNVKLNVIVGLIIGFLLGFAWYIIRDLMDTTIKDEDYLVENFDLVNLGFVGHIDRENNRDVVRVKNENNSHFSKRRV